MYCCCCHRRLSGPQRPREPIQRLVPREVITVERRPTTVVAFRPEKQVVTEIILKPRVVERDGVPDLFVSVTGRAVLGPVTGNFKEHCAVLERPTSEVGPEYVSPAGRAGERMRYREFLCPLTGLRIDSEIVRPGEDMLHDVRLAVAQ